MEKVVIVIDCDNEHNMVAPTPVNDDVMVMGPAYQIRGLMMSMRHQHQHLSHNDDVMAVGPAYQIDPIWVPRPPAGSCLAI